MPIIAIIEWPPADFDMKAEYERIGDEINGRPFRSATDWTSGLISHAVAETPEGGALAVDIWESQAEMDAWLGKVMPLTPDLPQPEVRVVEAFNVVTAAPVRA
jgi:hypothetical protein